MNIRRILLFLASLVVGGILVVVLIRIGKIDVRSMAQELRHVSLFAIFKITLLEILLILLSTEKWRAVDATLRRSSDGVPSRFTAFCLSSAGMALGLLVPVQVGMAAARTMGTYFYGRPLQRGTAGSLFEQSFDLMIVCFLAVASGITWLSHGGSATWAITALVMTGVGLLTTGPFLKLLRWIARVVGRKFARTERIGSQANDLAKLEDSAILSPQLGRRLLLLSALRFGAVVLLAWQTAEAINAHIALWQMAVVTPFVVLSTVLAITPGGIGLNEVTSVSILRLIGTPVPLAVDWSLANRVLVTVCCFAIALAAIAIMGYRKLTMLSAGRAPRTYKRNAGNVG